MKLFLCASAIAITTHAVLAGGTVFENWSEKTAVVNIAEDGRKGWTLQARGGELRLTKIGLMLLFADVAVSRGEA